jgi:hypothetical protein
LLSSLATKGVLQAEVLAGGLISPGISGFHPPAKKQKPRLGWSQTESVKTALPNKKKQLVARKNSAMETIAIFFNVVTRMPRWKTRIVNWLHAIGVSLVAGVGRRSAFTQNSADFSSGRILPASLNTSSQL